MASWCLSIAASATAESFPSNLPHVLQVSPHGAGLLVFLYAFSAYIWTLSFKPDQAVGWQCRILIADMIGWLYLSIIIFSHSHDPRDENCSISVLETRKLRSSWGTIPTQLHSLEDIERGFEVITDGFPSPYNSHGTTL